jgi:diguanylate cyclase (GGDEF)-like protein/PAS domain S-box-containing protein/putative nucleotidyltransferase with HDIG domain
LFRLYFTSLRLAFGLVCAGAGVLLSCNWLGLIPDPDKATAIARARHCDAMAVTTAGMIRASEWNNLEATLWTIVNRDPELLSIGLRTAKGGLRIDTGKHRDLWKEAQSTSGYSTVHIPITLNKSLWGQLEFCFLTPDTAGWRGYLRMPIVRIIGFFMISGSFVYSIFIARVLGIFDSVQVVPDRVRQALNTLTEGLLVLDEKEQIILANHAFATTVGISAEELRGVNVASLSWIQDSRTAPEDYPWRRAKTENRLESEQLMRYRVKDNSQRIFSINSAPIESSDRGRRGTLVTLRDVTQLEHNRSELEAMLAVLKDNRDEISRKNHELEILATQDSLTGCFNRRAFFERFEIAFRFSKLNDIPLSFIMVDNDHFKNVNDTYGHHIGDEVLRKVGALLRRLHSDTQVVCRFGGEEFCIMLPGYDLDDALQAAERIRHQITQIRLADPAELRLSASIGVSLLNEATTDPQLLINQADAALYVAKRSGRNRVLPYDPSMADIDVHASADRAAVAKAREESTGANPSDQISATSPPVRSLISALAFRDADTAEHSRRVADHCIRTARGIVEEADLSIVEVAALLHDIGKIGVPDHILLKPGSLTDAEWKLMGMHDQIGTEIVAKLFDSEQLLSIIRCHHCSFGRRKPGEEGPIGQDIPIAARILTIADSYDAMVSDRVYRKGRSHEEAVAELRRCSGTQFDPDLVERFVASFDQTDRLQDDRDKICTPHVQTVHFGKQIERLVGAVDAQDSDFIRNLTQRVRMIADERHLDEVSRAATQLETRVTSENEQWDEILRESRVLIDLCRQAQDEMVSHA